MTIENPEIEGKLGNIAFYSATYRLFKLDGLEPSARIMLTSQAVRYKGQLKTAPTALNWTSTI